MNQFFILTLIILVILSTYFLLSGKFYNLIILSFAVTFFIPFYIKVFGLALETLFFIYLTFIYSIYLIFRRNKIKTFTKYSIFLVLSLLIIAAFSFQPVEDIVQVVKESVLIFTVPVIIFQEKFTKSQIQKIISSIIFFGLIILLYGFYNYLYNHNPLIDFLIRLYPEERFFIYDEERFGFKSRVQSTIEHTITFGAYMIILSFLTLYNTNVKNKKINYIIIILFILGGIITGSRSVFILLSLSFLYYFFYQNIKNKISLLLVSILIFSILISFNDSIKLFFMSSLFFWDDTYMNKANIAGSSSELRVIQTNIVLNTVPIERILVGLGNTYFNTRPKPDGLLGAESAFFRIYLDSGLLGLITWIFYFTKIIIKNYKIQLKSKINISVILNSIIIGTIFFALATGFMGILFISLSVYAILSKSIIIHVNDKK